MNYFTAMASSPVYEFPYSGYQVQSLPNFDDDINALLSNITPSLGVGVYNQPASPTITLQCVPQINPGAGVGNNTIVYEVPESTSIDTILQQLGISMNTLQPSSTVNNYYRSASEPMEVFLPPLYPRRRLVCHEVSDSDDDNRYRHSPHHHRHRRNSAPGQAPMAIHDLLSRVWDKTRRGSRDLQSSSSAPNLDSQWQAMRNSPPPPPPPPNVNVNNVWQAMKNEPPPMPPDRRDAVSNVWQQANNASNEKSNRLSNIFNRMRQPMGNIVQPPTPPPQNREAAQNFLAARNLPYGINLPPPQQPNREAAQNFLAARDLPYGINLSPPQQPNREAAQNFLAARNLPYGINPNPAVANVWNRAGYAANQRPPPQPNQGAAQNFLAARNLPYGINPNPAVANVWNRAGYAANQPPPMFNASWNQMSPSSSLPPMSTTWNRMQQASPLPPPSMNTSWNRMQQGSPLPLNPSYMNPPYGGPQRTPAPSSFASLLSEAHRRNLPYAGAV